MRLDYKKTACLLLVLVMIVVFSPFVWSLNSEIVVDGRLKDWKKVDALSVSDGLIAGEMKAANSSTYLYLYYSGEWTSQIVFSADMYIDNNQSSAPFDAVRINADVNAPEGAFIAMNSWNSEIDGSYGEFLSSTAGEIWGYELLEFEVEIPLAEFGYTDAQVPEIVLNCTTFDGAELLSEQILILEDEAEQQEEVPQDEAEQQAEVPQDEAEQQEEVPQDEAEQQEEEIEPAEGFRALFAGSGLVIDGYYSDWEDIAHTGITWNITGTNVYEGALVLESDRLYLHLIGADNNKQLETNAMYLYINGNIAYDNQGLPTADNSMLIGIATVQSDMSMGSLLKKIKSPQIILDLGAFEYGGWPKRYLGEAAFTVYDSMHDQGDDCEFFIDLSEIADFYGVNENEIGEISMYFPRLGAQILTVSGVSTGPYLGIALGAIFVGGYFLMESRKKRRVR
ncbi:MAG: Firmicu-CTERM sorting domain-containing protein [Clostridia bacterium]|nr:Firmicu-CTERM sorting domain-containing protein [Clostridia bacterium]